LAAIVDVGFGKVVEGDGAVRISVDDGSDVMP
jgi:hypothetical protein